MQLGRIYPLADRIYKGQLKQRLSGWRNEGRSHDAIAFLLCTDGIQVSGETVRTWCRVLGVDKQAVA